MWFTHDDAPAHCSIAVCNHLQYTYPRRRVGRGKPVAWPPGSPDHNPLDLFFWGHLKSLVYETPVATAKDLLLQLTWTTYQICLNASICVDWVMTYAIATTNNSCDKQLSLHF
ncbi:uncharacterized protein TNCV_2597751 [Trichonephila clavipes]|nr:uncharacterized protein TNCV_2597751 [Trichonephila clavipes]